MLRKEDHLDKMAQVMWETMNRDLFGDRGDAYGYTWETLPEANREHYRRAMLAGCEEVGIEFE